MARRKVRRRAAPVPMYASHRARYTSSDRGSFQKGFPPDPIRRSLFGYSLAPVRDTRRTTVGVHPDYVSVLHNNGAHVRIFRGRPYALVGQHPFSHAPNIVRPRVGTYGASFVESL